MNVSAPFIRRPVMTTLVMSGLVLFGAVAYTQLPVSDLPNVDFPVIMVQAALPGASPDTMASSVATPLERQFSTIAGLDSMTSSSALGATQIILQFDLSRDLEGAAQDVQSAISAAEHNLPPEMPSPPTFIKVNPALQPILYIALTSPTLELSKLDDYGETTLAEQISMVSGVAQVQVYGSQKYAVRIQLDPQKLATRGISINQVASAITAGNVNLPTGTLEGSRTAYTIEATGQLEDAAAFRKLVVTWQKGSPVYLRDLGTVSDSVENDRTAAWFRDQRAIVLAIQRQPGTNTVEVANGVRALLPRLEKALPASVSLHVLYDRASSIRSSVNDVRFTLLVALGLVILVIFLFLRSLPTTVIPSLSLPASILGTFAVMYLFGYSLDNLSLMALILSVGFIVDDAIVLLENVVRHIDMGEKPMDAALKGSREIGFTIVSMTLSLAAIFIPVLFMPGIVGRLFHEFGVTIAAAVLVSGFVSLSLTPMLTSRFLHAREARREGRFQRTMGRFFEWLRDRYAVGLDWSLRHRRLVMIFSVLVLFSMVPLFAVIPKGFIPSEDTGQVFGFTEAQEGIGWDTMSRYQRQVAQVVIKDPAVDSFMSMAGALGARGGNTGLIFIRLKPRSERVSANQVIERLRPKLARLPGIQVFLQNPQLINVGARLTQAQYQFTLEGEDTKTLYRYAPILEQKMKSLPGLVDVTSDLEIHNPQLTVEIDREKAASMGVTPESIEEALFNAYGTRQVSTIYTPNNEYQVILELEPQWSDQPRSLSLLWVTSQSGRIVPLDAVARFVPTVGPLSVNHTGQLPSVTLSFNLDPHASLGLAVQDVEALARKTLPPSITTSFSGTAQAFQSSVTSMGLLVGLAILVIYLVLGILYESFIHPITILSALPFAGFGALLTLLVFGEQLSIYAFVGIIMLVGLVKKNGIMMVDFALAAERTEGKEALPAIREAALIRFRPILMTSVAAFMGVLPIAIGLGAGAESRRPLGLAVAGGLLFSQFLTLFVTPVFFTYMESLRHFFARRAERRLARGAPARSET